MAKTSKKRKTASASEVEFITPPNTLKAKVGPGAGIDESAVAEADAAVGELRGDYEVRVAQEIADLGAEFADMKAEGWFDVMALFDKAFGLKGEGGSYDYPLVSEFADSLCGLLSSRDELEGEDIDIAAAHLSALRAVVGGKVHGEGGAVGRELSESLRALVAKALASA